MSRARKVCAEPGCPTLVDTGRCPTHARKPWSVGRHDHGTTTRTGTAAYFRWRRQVMARDRNTCRIKGPGCTQRATEADHITPIAWGGAEYDPANGQGICHTCHEAKTRAEAAIGRRQGVGGTRRGGSP